MYTASHDSDEVKEAFEIISVDPVEDVECPVGTQGKQVMAGDRFGFSSFTDHEQLGQDGHRLKVDGECPENLKWREIVVDKEGEASHWNQEELNAKGVVVAVVCSLEFGVQEKHCEE